jgi:transcriptional regulator with XRE-family HTH domain
MSIGARIAEERKRLGFTQAAFAEKMGVSLSSQKRYETGERMPGMDYVFAASGLGMDAGYIASATRESSEQIDFFRGFDGRLAVMLAFNVLELDIDNFLEAVSSLAEVPGSPEAKARLIDALITNSPPLLERLNAKKGKSVPAKKR